MNWFFRFTPLLIVGLSYISYRYLPRRSMRLIIYFWIIAGILAADTLKVYFSSELLNAVFFQVALFMTYELFFTLIANRGRLVRRIAWLTGIALFLYANMQWFSFGFPKIKSLWQIPTVTSYTTNRYTYMVKDIVSFKTTGISRTFIYARKYPSLPFEKVVKKYTVPKGFEFSDFSYAWSAPNSGVQVNLIVDNYVLWSLGEGFK